MKRKDVVLAALSAGNDAEYTPVQVQKMFFLIDDNLSDSLGGPYFNFEPYNYGPFDKQVYSELEKLEEEGMVRIIRDRKWNNYALTEKGVQAGKQVLSSLDKEVAKYITTVSDFVRKYGFSELVSAIYEAYPEMRKNSVFQG